MTENEIQIGDTVRHKDDSAPLPGTVVAFTSKRGAPFALVGDAKMSITWPLDKLIKVESD